MKTQFEKAMNDEFAKELPFINIETAIKLAREVKLLDLIDANGKTIGIVAEIISRLKNAEFEILDTSIGEFEA
tara:strand:- start:1885 stop:2103 length:219 start_codon:yes stop_codon:yes gene_type:complete